MTPLYTEEELKLSKSLTLLPLQCKQCSCTYYRTKHRIVSHYLNPNNNSIGDYCSRECQALGKTTKQEVTCKQCGKLFFKLLNQVQKYPNHFCSHSCSATHQNTHKTYGNRRSKLERWIEEQLSILYPDLNIQYNQKSAINSELDIYIPSLNIAIELNGIFHYEPIYGIKKFEQIQNNDSNKFKLCTEAGINLCIIDTSQHSYVTPKTSQKYIDIIINIINQRLLLVAPGVVETHAVRPISFV